MSAGRDGPEPWGALSSEGLDVEVRAIAAGGAGVAELPDGRVCFVHRTAPGDRATVSVVQEKPRWARAELTGLRVAGPDRRHPPCPYYDRCGGCSLQHLHYDAQLQAKQQIVADSLARIAGAPGTTVAPIRAAPSEFGYRSRISFHLRRLASERVVAGFHRLDRPGRVVDVDGRCLLAEAPLARTWDELRLAWGPGARRLPSGRALRLTLRKVVGGVVLLVQPDGTGARRLERRPGAAPGDPEELLRRVQELRSVWWQAGGDEALLLAGNAQMEEDLGAGRRVRAGPGTFLQVNHEAAALLEAALLEAAGDVRGQRVVDAYCGVGSVGRRLAEAGAKVVGIEVDPGAVTAAADGAPDRFEALEGRVEDRIGEVLPADLVLLNPPRSGLAAEVPHRLSATGPARVIYVSCDPATFARDVARFRPAYELVRVQPFDLFPQTAHVELLGVLDRR